jgi:hypothetical protein
MDFISKAQNPSIKYPFNMQNNHHCLHSVLKITNHKEIECLITHKKPIYTYIFL